MIGETEPTTASQHDSAAAPMHAAADAAMAPAKAVAPAQVEIGGRDGPDPTRYGDWEKNGRCIDF